MSKKDTPKGVSFLWCGQQDSNLHAYAMEPKSTESTNSTMPAEKMLSDFYTGRAARGGAYRLIHVIIVAQPGTVVKKYAKYTIHFAFSP